MKLGTKLVGAFVAVSLIGAIVSVVGIRNMAALNDRSGAMYSLELQGMAYAKDSTINMLYVGRSIRDAVLSPTPDQRAQFLSDATDQLKQAELSLQHAKPLFWTQRGIAKFKEVETAWSEYTAVVATMRRAASDSEMAAHNAAVDLLFSDFAPKVNKVDGLVRELSAIKRDNALLASQQNEANYSQARNLMASLVLLALIVGIGLGWLISRRLMRQLGAEPEQANALAQSVAQGDLSTAIALRSGDTTSLMSSLRVMRDGLAALVADVRRNAEGVSSSSREIAQGNLDLSSRTEEQASALEQTAASMEELSSTVKQNAENAGQANQLAISANGVAIQGKALFGDVVTTMKSVSEGSRRIGDIVGVIDAIAFQTNILALNAAVEAARAGESGRGFAVVATEVRGLAQRSAAAAKEIKGLISESVSSVQRGSMLIDKAETTMQEVASSIQRVTDIVGEISAASSEQSIGVAQVSDAVSQMDHVTQQNAALVEQSAAAAESLRQQAGALVQATAVFKLGGLAIADADFRR
jgi:methyl-accepting chemotaxis protein